jgi:hypothetical protein
MVSFCLRAGRLRGLALAGAALVTAAAAGCAAGPQAASKTQPGGGTTAGTGGGGQGGASASGGGGGAGHGGAGHGGSAGAAMGGSGGAQGGAGHGGGGGSGGSGGAHGGAGQGGGGGGAHGGAGQGGGGGAGGGLPQSTVVVLAGGGASMLAGEWHPGGSWSTQELAEQSGDTPALVAMSAGAALGVVRAAAGGGQLRYTTWTPGAWTAFADVAANLVARAAPSAVASGASVRLVFHGPDYKHYYAERVADWGPTAEPVSAGGQSFGPSPASIAALGGDAVIAFAGNDHDVYDQTRAAGSWQGAVGHGLGDATLITPSIVALASGPELMIVYERTADASVWSATRTAGTWSAPEVIASALTTLPVALAALPGGGAVVAFHGTDDMLYWSRYTPGGTPAWSDPAGVAQPGVKLPAGSVPAVAAGVGGDDAELAYVNASDGAAYHARLSGMIWSAAASIGGAGLTRVAIASAE